MSSWAFGGLPHQVLVALALPVDGVDLASSECFAGAGRFGLLMEDVQAQAKSDGDHGKHSHGDAQALEGRPKIGVRGEWRD